MNAPIYSMNIKIHANLVESLYRINPRPNIDNKFFDVMSIRKTQHFDENQIENLNNPKDGLNKHFISTLS